MHRSSETLAALASALAKAQAELINPEKSLTAPLRPRAGPVAVGVAGALLPVPARAIALEVAATARAASFVARA
jgi:hypothetical protein